MSSQQQQQTSSSLRVITPQDVLSQKVISDSQISPDGNLIAFVIADYFKEEGNNRAKSNVWLSDLRSQEYFRFTTGTRTDNFPRWSPDGSRLAFLSDRSEKRIFQLYLMNRKGGEAVQLTDVAGEIAGFQWSSSGEEIALAIYDAETGEDKARSEKSGGAIEFEKFHKFCRIWILDLQSRELSKITGDYHVWEFDSSPDGKNFAALIADEPYEWSWHISKLAVIPVTTGQPRILFDPKPRQIGALTWSEDGQSIYYVSARLSDRPLIGGDLYRISAFGTSEKPINVTNDTIGTVHFVKPISNNKLLTLSVRDAKSLFATIDVSSLEKPRIETIYEGEVGLIGGVLHFSQPMFSLSLDKSLIAIVREDLQTPKEVWVGSMSEKGLSWKKTSDLNRSLLQSYPAIHAEKIEWKSFDGERIEGFVYYPENLRGQRLPLAVHEHGGPSTGYGYRFDPDTRYYASHGYAVLLPNPRGSMGRSVKFLEMNKGNIEGDDLKDIMAGVDYCIQRGLADPNNLFVWGGSYGGYLVAWTVSQTTRFNAAVMDFGISNLLSCHGTEWNTYWEMYQFDINPYSQTDLYNKKSAINYVRNVKTPTLIIHGKEDPCVPVTQGHEFFRALKELGIETQLVIYPREGHGYQERKHQIDSLERHVEWFEKHRKRS